MWIVMQRISHFVTYVLALSIPWMEMWFPYGDEEVLFSAAWATADVPNNTNNAHGWVTFHHCYASDVLHSYYIYRLTHYCNGWLIYTGCQHCNSDSTDNSWNLQTYL
jgi:hypothetical protein